MFFVCHVSTVVRSAPKPGPRVGIHLLAIVRQQWRTLQRPTQRRYHRTLSSTSFRYEPTAQDSSFLSNDEPLMFADPTTVIARPRVEATLEKKEHSWISAAPPSLIAPPMSGEWGLVIYRGPAGLFQDTTRDTVVLQQKHTPFRDIFIIVSNYTRP